MRHRRWRLATALGSAGLLLACAGDPPTGPAPARLSIAGLPVETLSPGDFLALRVEAVAEDGRPAPLNGAVTWRSLDPERVSVDDRGVVTALGPLGLGWVVAEVRAGAGTLRDSVGIWVQPPESDPSQFAIILHFADDVPAAWRTALEIAAGRWEEVIRDMLPGVAPRDRPDFCRGVELPDGVLEGTERAVRVAVVTSVFQGSTARASAGQCRNRGLPSPTTVVGVVILNRSRFEPDLDPGSLRFVAHHELGHTLGLAGAIQGHSPEWLTPDSYRGYLGRFGRSLDTGGDVQASLEISDGHWVRIPDVMGQDDESINNVSVGALMDMGYPAAWYGAGPLAPTGE